MSKVRLEASYKRFLAANGWDEFLVEYGDVVGEVYGYQVFECGTEKAMVHWPHTNECHTYVLHDLDWLQPSGEFVTIASRLVGPVPGRQVRMARSYKDRILSRTDIGAVETIDHIK